MATADAMFQRLSGVYRTLFDGAAAEPVSHALAHGRAKLSLAASANREEDDEEVAAYCADWIGAENRRAFFAQTGAGTVDQAILSVLPSKYQTLRLCGLADKVLVIDEAHAFDA